MSNDTLQLGRLLALGDSYLQDPRFTYTDNRETIATIAHDIRHPAEDVSGAVYEARDGEIVEIWVTGYRRPHQLMSIYERVR